MKKKRKKEKGQQQKEKNTHIDAFHIRQARISRKKYNGSKGQFQAVRNEYEISREEVKNGIKYDIKYDIKHD